MRAAATPLRTLVCALVLGSALSAQTPAEPPAALGERVRSLLSGQARFAFGQPTAWLAEFQLLLQEAHRDSARTRAVEPVLIAFLASDASDEARKLVADDAAPFVTEESLPALLRMMEQPRTASLALTVLQRAELADGSGLEKILHRVPADQRAAVIRHLGGRRDPARLPLFEGLLRDGDPEVAAAALDGVARLGTAGSAARLEAEEERRGGAPDTVLAEAMLACAERLASDGDAERARRLYTRCLASGIPEPQRVAAELGLLRLASDPWSHFAERLRAAEGAPRAALLRAIPELPARAGAAGVWLASADLGEEERRHLLTVLAGQGDPAVRPYARRLLDSGDRTDLKLALRALRRVGTAEDVYPLVQRAAGESGPLRREIEATLAAMPSAEVDRLLPTLLDDPRAEVKRVVLAVVRERGSPGLESKIRALAESTEDPLRSEAVRTFGVVAGPAALEFALARLEGGDGAERGLWERVVYQLARKQPDPWGPTEALLSRLGMTRDEATAISLVAVLGGLKNPADLPALTRLLRDGRSGVRLRAVAVLAQWPDGAPANDLAALFAESDDATLRLEALRGAVRLVAADRSLGNTGKRERLEALLGRARDGGERSVVVAGFGSVRDLATLRRLVTFMGDPEVMAGAQTSIRQIAREFEDGGEPEARELLLTARALSRDDDFRAWVDDGLRRGRFDH